MFGPLAFPLGLGLRHSLTLPRGPVRAYTNAVSFVSEGLGRWHSLSPRRRGPCRKQAWSYAPFFMRREGDWAYGIPSALAAGLLKTKESEAKPPFFVLHFHL